MNAVAMVRADRLGEHLERTRFELDASGAPAAPLVVVDLEARRLNPEGLRHGERAARAAECVVIGVAPDGVPDGASDLAEALDFVLTVALEERPGGVAVPDLDAAVAGIVIVVGAAPRAALTLRTVLAAGAGRDVRSGLAIESLAYSMLLAAPEFARWRAARPRRPIPPSATPPVRLRRDGSRLRVELHRPERRNAFDRTMREALCEAFDLAALDASIELVEVYGAGPAFCSGGDLDEFGLNPDPAGAHLVRLERSVASRIEKVRERTTVRVHGACIGAGIELPSFAGRVVALPDASFRLPELAMGLIPGAGGTVGIARRIGRSRTMYLALSGVALDAPNALRWGLVDELDRTDQEAGEATDG